MGSIGIQRVVWPEDEDEEHRGVPTVAQLGAVAATLGMTLTELLAAIANQVFG